MEKYLSISEAAKIIGVSSGTLRRWDKTGKFESKRHPINNYRVYPESQINTLVEELQLEIKFSRKDTKGIKPLFLTNYGKLYNLDVIDRFNPA